MQTLTLNIQDNFVQDFLTIIEQYKDKVQLENEVSLVKDKNLEYDPYFYKRQKELHQIRDDIKSGKIEMVSHEQVWGNIKEHLNIIENR